MKAEWFSIILLCGIHPDHGWKSLKPCSFKNLEYCPPPPKKAWMTTSIFMEFLRVLDASIDMQGTNILLFVDNHAAQLENISLLWNIQSVHYSPNFNSYTPVDNELAHMAFSAQIYCVMIVRWVVAVEWRKREKNMTLNHWKIMQRTTLLTKLLNYSFTWTALLGMTQRMFGTCNWYSFIWNVQMSTCIYVWENTSLHTGINIPFYLFITFIGLGTKCKILNFCFFLCVSDNAFPARITCSHGLCRSDGLRFQCNKYQILHKF